MFKDIIGKYLYKAGFTPKQVQNCKLSMQETFAEMCGCLIDNKIDWSPLCRECGIEYNPVEDYTDWHGWANVLIDQIASCETVEEVQELISSHCGECTIAQAENLRKLIPQMWEEARKE